MADEQNYITIIRTESVKEGTLPIQNIFKNSQDVAKAASYFFRNEMKEKIIVISLDAKAKPIAMELVAVGTLNQCLVGISEVFRHAILSCAASIICIHNHPSGVTTPSTEDLTVSKRLSEAGKILGIRFLDHIIVGDENNYTSIRDMEILDL